MKPHIVVLGSSNTDMVVRLPRLPGPGETILGGVFSMVPGGKGANQAIAAARAGGRVTFVGRVGGDSFGREAMDALMAEKIELAYLIRDTGHPSGVAMICVDAHGENAIAVAPGANGEVSPGDIECARDAITKADILVAQCEVPLPSVRAAGILAASAGTRFILNPAPALPIDDALLRIVSVLTPNEHEAEALTGVDTTDDSGVVRAAHALQARGARTVIITLGERGAYVRENDESAWIPPFAVKTVDCTGAGDVFNGALAVALGEGLTLFEAARFAGAAAAIAVTRHGAQSSVPTRGEIDSLLLS
jgi:ribokinase